MKLPRLVRPRLITFDAFGTLYTPKGSAAQQYSEIVARYGVNVSTEEAADRFKNAYKRMMTDYPNYGKRQGLAVADWWKKLVRLVFADKNLSEQAVSTLYNHFHTKEAYHFFPDAYAVLHDLADRGFNVGILSNSDSTMRLTMEDMGIGQLFGPSHVCLSYETGYEKPSVEAFQAAQRQMLLEDNTDSSNCWHVGDDIKKDFEGALNAGWNSILVDRDGEHFQDALQLSSHNSNAFVSDNVIVNPSKTGSTIYLTRLSYISSLFQ